MERVRRGSAVALGMFDGMHIGHRTLVSTNTALATVRGLEPIVFTFESHPRAFLSVAPDPLGTKAERERIMRSLGAERVIFANFDKRMADMSAREFIEMLVRDYNIRCATVGFDYTFGRRAEGNVETLEGFAHEYAFELMVIPPVMFEGEVVSSTRIRACIRDGELQKARKMLGLE